MIQKISAYLFIMLLNIAPTYGITISIDLPSPLKVLAVATGMVATAGVAAGTYVSYQIISQLPKTEYTCPEHSSSNVGVVFSSGAGNPEWRSCTTIPYRLVDAFTPTALLLRYPTYFPARFFSANPWHLGLLPLLFGSREKIQALTEKVACDESIQHIFLVGHSCGAADTFKNVCAYNQPDKVRGAIMISPFAHTDDIVNEWVGKVPVVAHIARWVTSYLVLAKYGLSQQPIEALEQASAERTRIPLLFISAQGDRVVPAWSTERLAQAAQLKGFDVTHIHHPTNTGHDYVLPCNTTDGMLHWMTARMSHKLQDAAQAGSTEPE